MNNTSLILLDTHIWIWLLNGEEKLLSSPCLTNIEKAAKFAHLRISAISLWEVGMLEAKGRITFEIECMDWITKGLNAPGISLVPLTPEIAVSSSRLPGDFHGDPADRIIVATARKLGATLITKDNEILAYGKQNYLKVIPA